MHYKDIVHTDLSKLHIECQRQSSYYLEVCDLLADANEHKSKCKKHLDYIYHYLYAKVQSSWRKYFKEKPTIDATKAWVFTNKKYLKAQDKYFKASKEVDRLIGVRSSLDHKKKSLELVISLYNSGYWSEPHLKGEVLNSKTKNRRKKTGEKLLKNKRHGK